MSDNLSLFEIDRELQLLMTKASAEILEFGEVSPETDEEFRLYMEAATDKVDKIAGWIRMVEANENAKKAEKARLDKRASVDANGVERLKRYLVTFMENLGKTELRGKLNTVFLRSSKDELVVADGAKIPLQFYEVSLRIPFEVWQSIEPAVTSLMETQDAGAKSRFKSETLLLAPVLRDHLAELKKQQEAAAKRAGEDVADFTSPYPGTSLKPVKTVRFA